MLIKRITLIYFCFLSSAFTICTAQQPSLVLPLGHTSAINTAQLSPNGKKIVTASEDGTAKIWDAFTGLLLADLVGYPGMANSAEFSPDGMKIVMAKLYGIATIWDAVSGKLIVDLKGHHEEVKTAHFSPDGKKIITASIDSTAKIWEVATGKLIADLKGHTDWVVSGNFSREGGKIVTASFDSTARIWNSSTGALLKVLKGHSNKLNSAEFSPDGKKIVTTSLDSTARIWDAVSGKLIFTLSGHTAFVSSAHFSPDGKKIVTAAEENTPKVWDVATGKLTADLKGHTYSVHAAEFSPDGKKIVTAGSDKSIKIWDTVTGVLLVDIKGHTATIWSAQFSPDGKKIITAAGTPDNSAKIWDAATGNLVTDLKGHSEKFKNIQFSPDGKTIITDSWVGTTKLWDAASGNLVADLKATSYAKSAARYSPDGKKIVTISENSQTPKIWDAATGKLITVLMGHTATVIRAEFSPDGKKIITASGDDSVFIWDVISGNPVIAVRHEEGAYITTFSPGSERFLTISNSYIKVWEAGTGKLITSFKASSRYIIHAGFSPDGKKIITIHGKTAQILDASSGELIAELTGSIEKLLVAEFSPDNKSLVTVSIDGNAIIWDVTSGKLIAELEEVSNSVNYGKFIPDGKIVITFSYAKFFEFFDAATGKSIPAPDARTDWFRSSPFSPKGDRMVFISGDGTANVWEVGGERIVYTFFALDSTDHFIQVPAGYYQCTPGAAKLLHYVTKDLKVISFEQLDVKYNRPDKILEAIGNADTVLVRSYRKAYEKRIKKLGIDTTAFRDGYSVPEADFVNRNDIQYEQKNEKLAFHVRGTDSIYKLDRLNIWVNESPLYGQRGISIRNKSKNETDTTITLKLTPGENRIEASITNVNGTESYRMPLIVYYTPAVKPKEMTRFIGIGIDKFADNQYNLQYSVKDIRDLSMKLKEKYGNAIIIDTLFNEDVTVRNIKALKKKLLQTTANDKVIIAYSGHGMLSKDFDYYLSTYAVNFDKPEENGLAYDELESLLDSIPARKKLMLIDACHSGEVDKEDLIAINTASDSLQLTKGLDPVGYKEEGHLGLKNSFELMQSLFVNVGKSTGATIISAAAGTQFALERNDLKNGVFTFSILEAMKKYPSMKISELKKIVGQRVEELTNGLQKPTSRNETIAVDWNVW